MVVGRSGRQVALSGGLDSLAPDVKSATRITTGFQTTRKTAGAGDFPGTDPGASDGPRREPDAGTRNPIHADAG